LNHIAFVIKLPIIKLNNSPFGFPLLFYDTFFDVLYNVFQLIVVVVESCNLFILLSYAFSHFGYFFHL